MERIKALIDKLYHQKELGCTAAQLMPTVQLIQLELLQLQQKNGVLGTAKVAVTMPVNFNFVEEVNLVQQAEVVEEKKVAVAEKEKPAFIAYNEPEVKTAATVKEQEILKQHEYYLPKPVVEEIVRKEEQPKPIATQSNFYAAFDAVEEAPTLAQHQSKKEINELVAEQKESLNDRLKQQKTEVVHALKDTPIKDLRKGIGINDRFTFVSELFRGDDAMYERSIKTINGFGILSEAEYWINRELKFKLGWNDSKETVQHFYHLVRRRFS
ncbi:MAG: hypothetical protein ACTHOF_12120 [Flavisolibacter sp.]|jgi:hypothetical protein